MTQKEAKVFEKLVGTMTDAQADAFVEALKITEAYSHREVLGCLAEPSPETVDVLVQAIADQDAESRDEYHRKILAAVAEQIRKILRAKNPASYWGRTA